MIEYNEEKERGRLSQKEGERDRQTDITDRQRQAVRNKQEIKRVS